jgi:alpha-methylacyl-CoA racemase
VEFAGIGPVPFCGMLLSDLGADVIRLDRIGAPSGTVANVTARGRRSVAIDLKAAMGVDACLRLAAVADGWIEGYRPGVMERLGIGPDEALRRNPKLVFGRMTGWGQTGPYADSAGHDLNYIAISGALHAIGPGEKPVPPLNLVGDFGGGALYLAFGVLAAVLSARQTGKGQVVDCAMSDGAASLMAMFYGLFADGGWVDSRQANGLDGAAPFYDTYRCKDGKWIAIAALEPQFYLTLLVKLQLDPAAVPDREDRGAWPALRDCLAERIALRTQCEWCAIFDCSDACFGPVLGLADAPRDRHNRVRETFVEVAGVIQPAPAPRFSGTPGAIQGPPPRVGADSISALLDWGLPATVIAEYQSSGVISQAG